MKKLLNMHVYEDLFQKIQSNFYDIGDKLPTELEMQEIYGVSRAPIRQALGKLQAEGFIERKPGIGTVVVEAPGSGPWMPMGGFVFQFSKKWNQLQVHNLETIKVFADRTVSERLKVPKDQPVVRVTRIRTENDMPVFLLRNYYVDADVDVIKAAGDIFNMRQFAKEVIGIDFSYVREELSAVVADEQLSYYLKVDPGYPLLKIERISYDSNFQPAEYVEYYVKTEHWPYQITFGNDQAEMDM